ncbi:MAG: alpha/beta hydrolase [Methylobacter sp.]|nr:MAG: alpha/beta hydrolase [Methylobacter sp.]PPD31592.1 MAG: alpha/beta hydrolase [Methylomonas sp.]
MQTVDLAFETFGRPENPPLLILHGFLASSRNWRQIALKLAEAHYVYTLDQRNHGASPHIDAMDYPEMAADIGVFMDKTGLDKADILGHSMGGKVAMWFALHHPERVDKLLIADVAPVRYSHDYSTIMSALMALPLKSLKSRKEAELLLADAIPDLSYRQFLLQNLLLENGSFRWRIDLAIVAKHAANIIGFPDTSQVEAYQGDVLFLAGADSNFVDPDRLPALFPHAKLAVIDGAGHWLQVQQPEKFMQAVENFYAQY